jgi:hypothetical protein
VEHGHQPFTVQRSFDAVDHGFEYVLPYFSVSRVSQHSNLLAIGLGFGRNFKTFEWISTLPPILIVAIFKMYINRKFLPSFQHYIPSQQELQSAKIHSGQTDNTKNRLEKRFGHPALHSELFTPMLHAKMMPLLGQVYSGKIGSGKAKLEEYNGQKMDTHVVEGGIKIAAIEQVC